MLKRIFKMLAAQGAGFAFSLIIQLSLPAVFIGAYGIVKYGEWLVLSATLAYLTTMNFGITTYASNELTMLRQRGEIQRYKILQASTLASLIALIGAGTLVTIALSLLPLPALLHLKTINRSNAAVIAFFLGMQMMCHVLGGYYNNLFMVTQETHRGQLWASWRSFVPTAIAIPLAIHRSSFATIAIAQFAVVLLTTLATIIDLRGRLGGLPLGLRGANWPTAKSALAPSAMFAMVFTQQFLLFQVPVILLQRILGPEIVVLFTICRTILSMARRLLSTITNAIAPEITFSFGSGDMKKLLDIFHYSERVVFSLVPVANLGALLFSPVLLAIWLHKPSLFETYTYTLMALVSAVMSMREHKQFFQFSTNVHHRLAHIVFWGNLAMICRQHSRDLLVWPARIHGHLVRFGDYADGSAVRGEQKALRWRLVHHADARLQTGRFMGLLLPLCLLIVQYGRAHSLVISGLLAAGGTAVIFVASYAVFGLNVVRRRLALGEL